MQHTPQDQEIDGNLSEAKVSGEFNQSGLLADKYIFVVRHGQSEGQLHPELYGTVGDTGLVLTPQGYQQARRTGSLLESFHEQARLESPLSLHFGLSIRTNQTAEGIISSSNNIVTSATSPDERLDKQAFGLFDGMLTSAERAEKLPDAFAQYKQDLLEKGPFKVRPPEGESIQDVLMRIHNFDREILKDPNPSVVVTHGLQALCIEADLLGHDENWIMDRADTIENGSIRLIYGNEKTGFQAASICENPLDVENPDQLINDILRAGLH